MINYQAELNEAQLETVNALDGPVLVIAGAGSGKTRTIIYRLARLVESGAPASSILLLTFTRKAAQEMLTRARLLLGHNDAPASAWVQGGTFHAFAYSLLRVFRPAGYARDVTVMDSQDALTLLQTCREETQAGKGDRSFPRNQTIISLLSRSRNRELGLEDMLRREAPHLLPHAETLLELLAAYAAQKRAHALLDYDDLLFELEKLLRAEAEALNYCRRRYRHLMLDEFQDTNPAQARLAALLAGADAGAPGAVPGSGNIMAVGDDAQSIYAFRGADIRNILDFPQTYQGTRLIRLEENYRSTQPVLDLCNALLSGAKHNFKKHLFTSREGEGLPKVLRPHSDETQGPMAAELVLGLLEELPPSEIAVLFRAGYQSFRTEAQLAKLGVPFRKYGGLRFTEKAHARDLLAFVRLALNPLDLPAFLRLADLVPGLGPKGARKLHSRMQKGWTAELETALKKHPQLREHLEFLDRLRSARPSPSAALEEMIAYYQPILEGLYPDNYPRRRQDLDELARIAAGYERLDDFAADFSLNDPLGREEKRDCVTLSTIHSAKGLEWEAVILLDLVEERFPSAHAYREEDFEEERRLMYVACSRAKSRLLLCVPRAVSSRQGGCAPARTSPFVRELSPSLYEEWLEDYSGGLRRRAPDRSPDRSPAEEAPPAQALPRPIPPRPALPQDALPQSAPPQDPPARYGLCSHKIFGRGKILRFLPPDKYQVNFQGFGLKVIMASFLSLDPP